jgi:hypothetical protein
MTNLTFLSISLCRCIHTVSDALRLSPYTNFHTRDDDDDDDGGGGGGLNVVEEKEGGSYDGNDQKVSADDKDELKDGDDDDISLFKNRRKRYDDVIVLSGYSGCGVEVISEMISSQLAQVLVAAATIRLITIDIRRIELQSLSSSSSTSTSADEVNDEVNSFLRFIYDCININNATTLINNQRLDSSKQQQQHGVLIISLILSPTRHIDVENLQLLLSAILQSPISLSITTVIPSSRNNSQEDSLRYVSCL